MLAIIGGTGLSKLDGFQSAGVEQLATDYDDEPVTVELLQQGDTRLAFLPRHGAGHKLPPHKINYRANLSALHKLGVSQIVAINAVGGIHEQMCPGGLAVPDQIIDYSHGRAATFFEDELEEVVHIDFTEPFDEVLRQKLIAAVEAARQGSDSAQPLLVEGVYGCTQGPRLETAAEIRRLLRDGCDMVGMTGMPEAALARELNIPYAMLALSVNWGAGLHDGGIQMEDILKVLEDGMGFIRTILQNLVRLP